MYDFGDRKQFSIDFAESDSLMEVELSDIDKIDYLTLYSGKDRHFYPLKHFRLNSYAHDLKHINAKTVYKQLTVSGEYKTKVEDLKRILVADAVWNETSLPTVQSPYDLEKYVISTPMGLLVQNNKFDLYSTKPMQVSIMGINNVVDLYYPGYSDVVNEVFNSSLPIKISGSVLRPETDLTPNSIYEIISGTIDDLNLGSGDVFNTFSVIRNPIGTKLFPADDSYSLSSGSYSVSNLLLRKIPQTPDNSEQIKPHITIGTKPDSMRYVNEDSKKIELSSPLVTPTNIFFEYVGLFDDMSNMSLDVSLLNKKKGVGSMGVDISTGSNRSLYDVVRIGDKTMSYKDYILYESEGGELNKLLSKCCQSHPTYSIGYYNKHKGSLDFVYNNVKFSLKLNITNKNIHINLAEYNNYIIQIVNAPYTNRESNSNFEIIIDTNDKQILFLNYAYRENKRWFSNNYVYSDGSRQYVVDETVSFRMNDHSLNLNNTEILSKIIRAENNRYITGNDELYASFNDTLEWRSPLAYKIPVFGHFNIRNTYDNTLVQFTLDRDNPRNSSVYVIPM